MAAQGSSGGAGPLVKSGPAVHAGLPSVVALTTASGALVRQSDLRGRVVALYFSGHWCGPCRAFTPVLAEFYTQHASRLSLEVIFVSHDQSVLEFMEYFSTMPWVAVPFDQALCRALADKYQVRGIPTLLLLDEAGTIITRKGVDSLRADPTGGDFPWPSSAFALEDIGFEHPVWRADSFFGMFGDPYLARLSGFANSALMTAASLGLVLDSLRSGPAFLGPDHSGLFARAVDPVLAALRTFIELLEPAVKLRESYEKPEQILPLVTQWLVVLNRLKPGQAMIVPGGWLSPRAFHGVAHVLFRETESTYAFVTTNSSVDEGLKYHPSVPTSGAKVKYRSAIRLAGIPRDRMLDPVFWTMHVKALVSQGMGNRCEVLYDVMLPWLADELLPSALEHTEADAYAEFHAPQRSDLGYYHSLLEAVRYLVRVGGLDVSASRALLYNARLGFFDMLARDVSAAKRIHHSERGLIRMAVRTLAHATLKEASAAAAPQSLLAASRAILANAERIPVFGAPRGGVPLPVDAQSALPLRPYPGFGHLLLDGEDRYAGAARSEKPLDPINFLSDRPPIAVFADAVAAVQDALGLCEALVAHARSGASGPIPRHHEIVGVVTRLVTAVLPLPSAPASGARCFYAAADPVATPAQQNAFIKGVHDLTIHFTVSWQSVKRPSRAADSERAIVAGALLALFDAGARMRASPKPILLSRLLAHSGGYSLSTDCGAEASSMSYERLTRMAELDFAPALCGVRSSVLAYFDHISSSCERTLFNWWQETASRQFMVEKTTPTMAFVKLYLSQLGYPLSEDPRETEMQALCRWVFDQLPAEAPEYGYLRDMVVMFKFLATMETELADRKLRKRAVHKRGEMWQLLYESDWDRERRSARQPLRFKVEGMNGDQTRAFVIASGFGRPVIILGAGLISQSPTDPEQYLHMRNPTEDDVLYAESLPSFDDALPEEDSEALVSYLTAEYVRLPLVAGFFSSRDRLSYLFSGPLRDVLRASVFELGSWLPPWDERAIDSIPVRQSLSSRDILGCASGLLLNEMRHSPGSVLEPLLAMVGAIAEIPANSVHSLNTTLYLYAIDVALGIEAYVLAALEAPTPSPHVTALVDYRAALRRFLTETARARLVAWLAEAEAEANAPTTNLCHGYLALIWRNARAAELTPETVSLFLGHLAFVRHWHDFGSSPKAEADDAGLEPFERLKRVLATHGIPTERLSQANLGAVRGSLERVLILMIGRDTVRIDLRRRDTEIAPPPADVPEYELFAAMDALREPIVRWLRAAAPATVTAVMTEVVRIALRGERSSLGGWVEQSRAGLYAAAGGDEVVDVQTAEVHFKGNMLRALPASVAEFEDYRTVFGSETFHCGLVARQEHRLWLSVVGSGTDLKEWDAAPNTDQGVGQPTPVDRNNVAAGLNYDSVAYVRNVAASPPQPSEAWIRDILGAVLAVQPKQDPVILLPAAATPPAANLVTALTVQIDKDSGQISYKLLRLFREFALLHAYDLVSHGRKVYPTLVYSSDNALALHNLPLKRNEDRSIVPDATRCQEGAIWRNIIVNPSLVIERVSAAIGGKESLLPSRLLHGLVPSVLLENYTFWQGEDALVRGYPIDEASSWFAQPMVVVLCRGDGTPIGPGVVGAGGAAGSAAGAATLNAATARVYKLRRGAALPRIAGSAIDPNTGSLPHPDVVATPAPAAAAEPAPEADADRGRLMEALAGMGVPAGKARMALAAQPATLSYEHRLQRVCNWIADNADVEVPIEFELEDLADGATADGGSGGGGEDGEGADGPLKRSSSILEAFIRTSELSYPEAVVAHALAVAGQDFDLAHGWLTDPANEATIAALIAGEPLPTAAATALASTADLELANLLYLPSGYAAADYSPSACYGYRLARLLARLEELSHVLVWTSAASAGASIALIELPRVGLRFQPRRDSAGVTRLFALDQAGWWVADLDAGAAINASLAALLSGIPHSMILENASGELRVLVPNCDIHRPMIAPFSTELVLARASAAWLSRAPTRYYLYTVHTTRTFLHAPSVAATLYLLLLRFAARDYGAVVRLSETCQVDVPFTPEEDRVFMLLGEVNGDGTPDAAACRCRLSLCVLMGENTLPWTLASEYDAYLAALAHVSAECRLDGDEEREVLGFIDPEARPLRVANRARVFDAIDDGASTVVLSGRVLKRGGDLQHLAILRQPLIFAPHHTSLSTVYYGMAPDSPYTRDDKASVKLLASLEQEEESGSTGKIGFLGLYDMLLPEPAVRSRLFNKDTSRSLAELQTRLFILRTSNWGGNEGVSGNSLTTISMHAGQLALLSALPWAPNPWPAVPRDRTLQRYLTQGVEVGLTDADNPASEASMYLREFFLMLHMMLEGLVVSDYYQAAMARIRATAATLGALCAAREIEVPLAAALGHADPAAVMPRVQSLECGERTLRPFSRATTAATAASLKAFATRPLAELLPLDSLLVMALPGDEPVRELPFDLRPHPAAASAVAQRILERLSDDVAEFHTQQTSTETLPRLATLHGAALAAILNAAAPGPQAAALAAAHSALESIESGLLAGRAADEAYIAAAVATVRAAASAHELGEAPVRDAHALRRLHGQRADLDLDFITCALLSTASVAELQSVNPFLSAATAEAVLEDVQTIALRASRVAQASRALAAVRSVATMLGQAKTHGGDSAYVNRLHYEVEAAGECLGTERHYMRVDASGAIVYDPRFLVFEHMFDLLLRKRQVSMVLEFLAAATAPPAAGAAGAGSNAMVQQMLMGAGKTTVIGPLLALILADGKRLVTQVVPTPLLDMSRNVMRSRFTSIVPKRVYTFAYDRAEPDNSVKAAELLAKLEAARRRRAVVCTTPDALKSLMLKYVEQLHSVEEPAYVLDGIVTPGGAAAAAGGQAFGDGGPGGAPSPNSRAARKASQLVVKLQLRSDASDVLSRILGLWHTGVLLLDEVDVLLHPLRSELNYPIGEKAPIDMEGSRWDLPIHLLDAVFSHKRRGERFEPVDPAIAARAGLSIEAILSELYVALDDGYAAHMLQRTPHVALMAEEFYHARLKAPMAKWALLWIHGRALGAVTAETDDLLAYLTSEPYVGHAPVALTPGASSGAAARERVAASKARVVAALLPLDVKLVNLAADYIISFLPHILAKVNRVSYGILSPEDIARADPRMPKSRRLTAVPFVGKDVPSRSSEFAQPDVVIGLTILAYRYEGVRKSDLRRVVEQLKKDFGQEIGPPDERPSAAMFADWLRTARGRHLRAAELGTVPPTPNSPAKSRAAFSNDDAPLASPAGGAAAAAAAAGGSGSAPTSPSGAAGSPAFPAAAAAVDHGIFPLQLFQPSDPQQLDRLYAIIKRHPPFIHYYLRRHVFPPCMAFRRTKISASGQELGSDILYAARLGFSGTPSNLMPADLGECKYEAGSDGKVVHVLTSPAVVSWDVKGSAWTAKSILRDIASMDPPAHALIDTGALITGLDNEAVAAYLLPHLPAWMEGVVYLDRSDRQMILLRSSAVPVSLAQCGVAPDKRFTFYDQVHTTGMDIKQAPNARAVLTVGKDMTFRDYAQGAFRMRGIGRGQTIRLCVIPEVANRIREELHPLSAAAAPGSRNSFLNAGRLDLDVAAWLLISSMSAEALMFIQLCLQELHGVWRKTALRALEADSLVNPSRSADDRLRRFAYSERLTAAVCKFREAVEFSVPEGLPEVVAFEDTLDALIAANAHLVSGASDTARLSEVRVRAAQVSRVAMETQASGRSTLDAEIVNENEQEAEQEAQKEKDVEKQKEREVAYNRDDEGQNPWLASLLAMPPDEHSAAESALYPMSKFHLSKTHAPIDFPSSLLLSDNFFRPSWVGIGERRLKNICLLLEWVPVLTAPQERYFVALSLKEGQTVHRLLHRDQSVIAATAGIGLLTIDGQVLNRSAALRALTLSPPALAEAVQHRDSTGLVCLRFANNCMFYSDGELELLCEGLARVPEDARREFFETTLRYRRRERQYWTDTPVAKVFTRREEWGALRSRALMFELSQAMGRKRTYLRSAFERCDSDGDGQLTQDELLRAFGVLKLGFSPADIVLILQMTGSEKSGRINFADFTLRFAGINVQELLDAEALAAQQEAEAESRRANPASQSWRCPGCASLCRGDRDICLECGRSKEEDPSIAQLMWCCHHCTKLNPRSEDYCTACDYGRCLE